MELKNLITKSYGESDLIFQSNSLDTERAIKSIQLAKSRNINLERFLELHMSFLESKSCLKEHITIQLKKVEQLWISLENKNFLN